MGVLLLKNYEIIAIPPPLSNPGYPYATPHLNCAEFGAPTQKYGSFTAAKAKPSHIKIPPV